MEFGGQFKQMIRSAGVYTVGLVASRIVSVLMLPIYTRYIKPADNMVIEMLDTMLSLFSIIAGQRFASAISYFYSHAEGPDAKREVVSTMMLGGGLIGITGAAAGFVAAPWVSQWVLGTAVYTSAARISFATFAALLILEIVWGWLRSENRAGLYVTATMVHLLTGLSINVVLLVIYGANFYAILWSALISALAVGLPIAIHGVASSRSRFNRVLFVSICRFAAPVGVSGLAAYVLHYGERFFLRGRVDAAELGLYLFGYKLGMTVSFLQTGFNLYWNAQVYNEVRGEQGKAFLVRVFTYFMTVMTFACFALAVGAGSIVQILADSSYHGAIRYVPWIAGAYWMRAAADFFRSIFFLYKQTRTDAVVNLEAALLCLGAYALLIPSYRIPGAIAATLFGFLALMGISFYEARALFPFTLEWRRLGKLMLTATVLGAVHFAQPFHGLAARTASAAGVCIAFPALLWALRFFNAGETAWMRRKLG